MHSDGVNRKLQKDKMDAGCRNTTCIFLYCISIIGPVDQFDL